MVFPWYSHDIWVNDIESLLGMNYMYYIEVNLNRMNGNIFFFLWVYQWIWGSQWIIIDRKWLNKTDWCIGTWIKITTGQRSIDIPLSLKGANIYLFWTIRIAVKIWGNAICMNKYPSHLWTCVKQFMHMSGLDPCPFHLLNYVKYQMNSTI